MDLLTDQLRDLNVIILNKIDLNKTRIAFLKKLNKLNPSSKIIESTFSKINKRNIEYRELDFEEAEQNAGWIEELNFPPIAENMESLHLFTELKNLFDPIRLPNSYNKVFLH